MSEYISLGDLTEKLADLEAQLAKKRRDKWEKAEIAGKIFAGVLLGAVGTYFTITYNNRQGDLKELEVVAKFIDYLAGSDEGKKKVAITAISELASPRMASRIAELNASPGTAAGVATIARDPQISNADRQRALEALRRIQSILPAEVDQYVGKQEVSRKISLIGLGHSFMPSAATFRGDADIENIYRYHTQVSGWADIGPHFFVAPDGRIWLGRSLDRIATFSARHNQETVYVQMILDGNTELPSTAQADAVGRLLSALCTKFDIDPAANFSEKTGFRRDYAKTDSPGKNITKDKVLGWIAKYR